MACHIGTELSTPWQVWRDPRPDAPLQQTTPSCTTALQGHRAASSQPHLAPFRVWQLNKVKRFSAPLVPRPPAPPGTGHYEGKRWLLPTLLLEPRAAAWADDGFSLPWLVAERGHCRRRYLQCAGLGVPHRPHSAPCRRRQRRPRAGPNRQPTAFTTGTSSASNRANKLGTCKPQKFQCEIIAPSDPRTHRQLSRGGGGGGPPNPPKNYPR